MQPYTVWDVRLRLSSHGQLATARGCGWRCAVYTCGVSQATSMGPAIRGRLRACVRLVAGVIGVLLAPALPVTTFAGPPTVEVVVYRSGGCGSWREAISTVKSAARELNIRTKIRVVKIGSADEAERLRFHGSPSVVIDGIDVEGPAVAERPASYG